MAPFAGLTDLGASYSDRDALCEGMAVGDLKEPSRLAEP
jgi:hypothetical protein